MKANFKFKPGANVVTANGLTGRIETCGLTSQGKRYHVCNAYAEEWVDEKDIKLADGKEPEPEKDEE